MNFCGPTGFFIIIGLALVSCQFKSQQPNIPNIILIMADDMGYECLGVDGSAEYQTPYLDKMASEGIRFNHFYSQPLCTPSRVKIMTGKYNFRNYSDFGYLNLEEETFGNLLRKNGYRTMIAGKWQLNGLNRNNPGNQDRDRPHHFGFDEYCLWQLTKRRNQGERYADPLVEQNGKILSGTEGRYGPDIFCNYILDFLERNRDSTFFIYYPMVLVHEPFVPTPDSETWVQPDLRYQNDTSYYADMVAYADKLVGRIIHKVEELGLTSQTLILFTGDNGTHQTIYSDMKDGSVIRGGKGLTLTTGIHVPAIACWKNHIAPGIVTDYLISFTDIYPTLMDVAQIESDNHVADGKSFYPLLIGANYDPSAYAYEYYHPRWGSFDSAEYILSQDFKLYSSGKFYRILEDPLELDPVQNEKMTTQEKSLKERWEKVISARKAEFKQ
jgi:arylsulfatase A